MVNIDSKKYVLLDVETNGLSSLQNDLLSISLYRPDDGKIYDRFLPLELEEIVWPWISEINGIDDEMLIDKLPLTQEEFDSVISDFDLENRIILHYGNIDEKFLKNYLKRKKINGFEKLSFYNFKHDIISNKFSEGNITKDNLCRIYGIENVNKVHTGLNDCILEWKLFEKMNGNKLIVIGNTVYEFNDEYIIPVSYLQNYTNFKYHINNFPKISYDMEEVKTIRISSPEIKKFDNNISGITIEHLINSLLNVEDKNQETMLFQAQNRGKLKKIGELPSMIHTIPISMNTDGTITAINKEDRKTVNDINKVTEIIKKEIKPLIDFIKHDIFNDELIMSQELVINKEDNVLAKCDLSTDDKILEIKGFNIDVEKMKYQLYYEANGREIYILQTFWRTNLKQGLKFVIYKVIPKEYTRKIPDRTKSILKWKQAFEKKINNKNLEVIEYQNSESDVKMRCKICGMEWKTSYRSIIRKPLCINCNKNQFFKNEEPKRVLTLEEKNRMKLISYQEKLTERSHGKLLAINYHGSREKLSVGCSECGNVWKIRADHLLDRPYCPKCRKK